MSVLNWSVVEDNENVTEIEKKYPLKGDLTGNKLMRFLPALIATNISTMLLITVDSLVAGNMVGADALASISFFNPILLAIGALTAIVSMGSSTVLSLRMGDTDTEGLNRAKDAIKKTSIIFAIIISIVQIPVVYIMIKAYGLSGDVLSYTTSYAIGIMCATPFSVINTVGVYQLQAIGKMKVLMGMAILEGVSNLVLDLVFVGLFDMGVAGTGYGTLCANIIRCVATVLYLFKKSDMYNSGGVKSKGADVKEIIVKGLPEAAYSAVSAIQNYVLIVVLIEYFGDAGGVIKGVAAFAFSIANVMMTSVQGAARPMVGLMNGVDEKKSVRRLLQQSINLTVLLAGVIVAVVIIWPELFYTLQGVKEIPKGGELSLKLYAISFILLGINAMLRMYFTAREYHRFSTIITAVGNIVVPLFAYVIGLFMDAPYIWLSFTIAQLIILFANFIKYGIVLKEDRASDVDIKRIYLSVEPEEATDASRMIQEYALENNYSEIKSNRIGLCMEEMVAYSVKASSDEKLRNQIMFCFSDKEIRFVMLDDGECIIFDKDSETQSLVSDNYGVIKRIADSVSYNYVLDLNDTVVTFATE